MIPITFFRSSSFVGFDFCQQSYFLTYNLGMKSPSGRAACKGTIVHKVMECLAHAKKCKQDGTKFFDDEALGKVFIIDCIPQYLIDRVYEYYSTMESHIEWKPKDYRDCKDWTFKALAMQNGRFDPRKANIVKPEQHFDIEIPNDWAHYRFETHNGVLEGQLRLKGTIDLITRVDKGVLEVTDYKTGRRLSWSDMSEKTYKKLCNDPQLRIYHYAISRLFPEEQTVLMTINFMNDGGAYTVCFQKEDLLVTERMLRHQFERVKNTIRPKLSKSFKCTAFCHFGKTKWKNTSKTICEHIKDETIVKGTQKVTEEYSVDGFKLGYYQAPGGTT